MELYFWIILFVVYLVEGGIVITWYFLLGQVLMQKAENKSGVLKWSRAFHQFGVSHDWLKQDHYWLKQDCSYAILKLLLQVIIGWNIIIIGWNNMVLLG